MKPEAPVVPRLPDRYSPLRWLGHGGSSDVLLVEDAAPSPQLKALKLLKPDNP